METHVAKMTDDDFAALLASVDDKADHHILWIDRAGYVHISPVGGLTPAGWAEQNTNVLLRCETWVRGNGYCGPAAAKDKKYVTKTLGELRADFEAGKTGYVDY